MNKQLEELAWQLVGDYADPKSFIQAMELRTQGDVSEHCLEIFNQYWSKEYDCPDCEY